MWKLLNSTEAQTQQAKRLRRPSTSATTFFWSTDTRTYNDQGSLSTILDQSDDGLTFLTDYNIDHLNPWNLAVTTYDAQDRGAFVSIYTDGGVLVTGYDAAGDQSWSYAVSGYDGQGRLEYVTVVNDDNTQLYTRYSFSGNTDYSIYSYDTQNNLTQSYIHYRDGTHDIIT